MTSKLLLARGLEAYARLQATFDPDGQGAADLRDSGVVERQVRVLYPLDFAAYLPELCSLLADYNLTESAVKKCYARDKLSADRIELAGIDFPGFNEFYENFVSPASNLMDELFTITLLAYTRDLTLMPTPSFERSALDQAHMEVGYLMENLTLSAVLLANWSLIYELKSDFSIFNAIVTESVHRNVLDVTLNFFDAVWQPLLSAKTALPTR